MPGPPPRTSTLATTAASNTTTVVPERELAVAGMAHAQAGNIGDEVA